MDMANPVKLTCRLLVTIGMCWFSMPLAAAEPSGTIAPLQACRKITDPEKRVACYDSAVDQLTAAVSRNQVTFFDKAEVKEARKGLFGFNIGKVKLFESTDKEAEDRKLVTTITSARALHYGTWRFAVEGGAIWETTEADTAALDPKPGMKVELEKGALGGYFARVGSGLRVRAKRVN